MSLTNHPYISLRTYRKTGATVDTPVWFASENENTHYVFSAADAGKVKRLRNSTKSQIATCDARGGSVGEWQDTESFLVNDEAECEKAYELLGKKYGWQMTITNFFSRLTGKINNRQVIRIETSA